MGKKNWKKLMDKGKIVFENESETGIEKEQLDTSRRVQDKRKEALGNLFDQEVKHVSELTDKEMQSIIDSKHPVELMLGRVAKAQEKMHDRGLYTRPQLKRTVGGEEYSAYKACCYIFMQTHYNTIQDALDIMEVVLQEEMQGIEAGRITNDILYKIIKKRNGK